jgi:hypothetical protein
MQVADLAAVAVGEAGDEFAFDFKGALPREAQRLWVKTGLDFRLGLASEEKGRENYQ